MKENKLIPKRRFKEFENDEAWERCKLGDIAERICVGFVGTCEMYYTDEHGIPMFRTGNLNGTELNFFDLKYVTKEFHERNKKSQLKYGDILIARHGDSGKAVIYELEGEANCLNIVIIRPNLNKSVCTFMANCINSPTISKHIKQLSAGSTQSVINTKEIENLTAFFPKDKKEQKKIGTFFTNLDNLINLHQRKLKKLKETKSAYLSEMFPKEGEKYPRRRFDGFTKPWEQRKLGDMCSVKTGYAFNSIDFDDNGELLVITNGNIQKDSPYVDGSIGNRIDIKDNITLKEYVLNKNEILVTMDGTVGRIAKVLEQRQILAQRVGRLIAESQPEFLYQFLNTGDFFNKMALIAHGGTIKHISLTEISDYMGYVPSSNKEQQKIGSFFKNMDNLITLHQRKLEKLENLKKAYLNEMFV